jgi:radical SAM protein (TIGR01212 family)
MTEQMDWKTKYDGKRFNSYSTYLNRKYGERVQKVTVDAGFTCPNRDGTVASGGCTYCNNESFNPGYNSADKSVTQQIAEGVEFLKRRYKSRKYIVYFQPYSNTYASLDRLRRLYDEALSHPEVIGLTIGTRPDCVDTGKISYLAELAQNYDITIEYGLESVKDESLKKINRGHDYQTYLDALKMTTGRGIKICTHIILGFPWENREDWLEEARILSELPMDFLKIHQLHIVRDTAMARQFEREKFKLLTYDEYISVLIAFLERLNPDIIIQRMFGEAPPHTLLAPRWGKRNSEALQRIECELIQHNTWQGKLYISPHHGAH